MAITDSNVKAVIETSRDTSPFITTASLIVSEELSGKGLSTERLDQITLYLAAHFVCLIEENGGLRRSKLGDGDDSYVTPDSKQVGLAMTRYGQQAMMLDSSGTLASMSSGARLRARFNVIAVSNYDNGVATSDAGAIDPSME